MLSHQIKTLLSEYVQGVCNDKVSTIFDATSQIKGASDFSLLLIAKLDIMENLTDFSALETIHAQSTTTNQQLSFDTPELEDSLPDDKPVSSEEPDSESDSNSNTKSKNYVSKKWPRELIENLMDFSLDQIKTKKRIHRDKLLAAVNNIKLNEIPIEDRIKHGNKNAAYVAKYWKNINNRLIQTGKVSLVDDYFIYN
jgi:hypothetical protein